MRHHQRGEGGVGIGKRAPELVGASVLLILARSIPVVFKGQEDG